MDVGNILFNVGYSERNVEFSSRLFRSRLCVTFRGVHAKAVTKSREVVFCRSLRLAFLRKSGG